MAMFTFAGGSIGHKGVPRQTVADMGVGSDSVAYLIAGVVILRTLRQNRVLDRVVWEKKASSFFIFVCLFVLFCFCFVFLFFSLFFCNVFFVLIFVFVFFVHRLTTTIKSSVCCIVLRSVGYTMRPSTSDFSI